MGPLYSPQINRSKCSAGMLELARLERERGREQVSHGGTIWTDASLICLNICNNLPQSYTNNTPVQLMSGFHPPDALGIAFIFDCLFKTRQSLSFKV